MFSPTLESAINAEVTKRLAAHVTKLRFSVIAAINSAFDEASSQNAPEKLIGYKRKYIRRENPKQKRTLITPELRKEIVARIESGKTLFEIAEHFHVAETTVQRIKKKWMEEPPAPPPVNSVT